MTSPVQRHETSWSAMRGEIIRYHISRKPDYAKPSALTVAEALFGKVMLRGTPYDTDQSFIRQFRGLREMGTLNPRTLFLVTADSAVPLADTIRGLFDGLGIERPGINYAVADIFHSRRGDAAPGYHQEIERLGGVVAGAAEIVVVDQLSCTGGSATYAARLALAATQGSAVQSGSDTPPTVHVVLGDWYADFAPENELDAGLNQSDYVDYEHTTVPVLANCMLSAGLDIAQAL